MYPYHNKIKQRIRKGELVGYEFVQDYPGIGEALVLQFNTEPFVRPIRPHRYVEYVGCACGMEQKAMSWGSEHEAVEPGGEDGKTIC